MRVSLCYACVWLRGDTSGAAAEMSDCELLALSQPMERLQRPQRARRVLHAERRCVFARTGGGLGCEVVHEVGSRGKAGAVVETCRTERTARA